jgi:ATP-dependent helicase/nuclease subunit B
MKRKRSEGDQAELPFAAAATELAPAIATTLAEPPPAAPRRVFLGWDAPALPAAADWLLAEFHADLADVVVALPGARAARRLRELLARRAPPSWRPPRVLTQGELTDELVLLDRPVAGRVVRTLAWERALATLTEAERGLLVRARPMHGAPGGYGTRDALLLAEIVRGLHGELAPEGLDFARLASGPARPDAGSEGPRWEALAKAQADYRARLDRLGLADPHEARLAAIEAGRVARDRRVVLVGVADMNRLLARLLERTPERVTALVVAPHGEADGFDELGRLHTAAWRARPVPLALADWIVAEKPVDQAAAVGAAIGRFEGRFAADEVTIGVADDEVLPYLERRLGEAGALTRRAAGTPIESTPPVRLLRAVQRFLEGRGFAELAELARDPDLAPALHRDGDSGLFLDEYYNEHLPSRVASAPPRAAEVADGKRGDAKRSAWVARVVNEFEARLLERLGELASRERRPLAAWVEPMRGFLADCHARPLDPTAEPERLVAESLARIGAALGELESIPAGLDGEPLAAADALGLLLRDLRGERVPPRPDPGPVVELLGWLDLPLDDAPAFVVTGFEEGRIPRSIGAHAFLPDGIRAKLDLPTDDDRLARDVFAATVILSSRSEHVFVTGRRNAVGDPLVPSRLAFHCPEGEIVGRVKHFLHPDGGRRPAAPAANGTVEERPVRAETPAPETMSVSSFRTYLDSPYLYYLKCVERLRTLDDRTHELDPLAFGILTHAVLRRFGERGPRDSLDEREIAAFLRDTLDELAGERFPDGLPAVAIQLEQLRYRLGLFAAAEAQRRRQGWRIHAVEWSPPEERWTFDVDGTPVRIRGQIDRIDVHGDGRWAILDYKSGDGVKSPEKAHRRGGAWVDLQLPLYRWLARGLFPDEPALGYASLGKDEANVRFDLVTWTADELDGALEAARDVVRGVRRRDFGRGTWTPYEPILRALLGEGMIGGEAAEE